MKNAFLRSLSVLLLLGVVATAGAASGPAVFINEIHYDNAGTDAGEMVEVAGPAGTTLAGWSLVPYNGNGGASYTPVVNMTGSIPNQLNGFGTLSFPLPGLQNGSPDGIALVNGTTVIQFLSYEGTFTAVGGPAAGMTSVDIGVSQAGADAVGLTLQLKGTGTNYGDFSWASSSAGSAGAVNTGQTFSTPPPPVTPTLSINDVAVTEGNSGTVTASFTVSLSAAATGPVTFNVATTDQSANSPSDYIVRSTSGSIAAGSTIYTFDVTVNGDIDVEAHETFAADLTGANGATIGDAQGIGTISNDDAPPPANVVISQIYGGGGNAGATLRNDFIELFNRGDVAVSLTGWSVQYQGATGTGIWAKTDLSGSIAPGHYYLVQQAPGTGGTTPLPTPDATGSLTLGSGAGKVALVSNTTALNGTCPGGSSIADFVGYGATACFEGAGPTGSPSNTTAVARLKGGCIDTNSNAADFTTGSPAPRNSATPARDCSATPLRLAINEIQGSGAVSPYVAREVETRGIVTARKINGFFMQSSTADSFAETSEGLFVFTSSTPSALAGDAVTVVGAVSEFFGLTQISALAFDITVTGSGNPLPSAVTLTPSILDPAGALDQLERYEGMLLAAGTLVSIAPTHGFGEVFTTLPAVQRPMREPGLEISSPLPAGAPCCIPRFDENPERIIVDTDGILGTTPLNLTTGVTLSNLSGPLDYSFGAYKLLPTAAPSVSPNASATPAPAATSNEFTIASMNLLNFFTSNPNFAARLGKASAVIRNVQQMPDIIGVQEVGDLAALTALANRINLDAGVPNPLYQAVLLEGSDEFGGDDIDVGFLVKTSRVSIVSVTQEGKGLRFQDPGEGDMDLLFERPPLVLRASILKPTGSRYPVTVIVNHMQSLIDVDDPVRGPRQRLKRQLQAEFTANLVQSLQGENLVLVGDFNAFQFSDGYVDVIGTILGTPTPAHQVLLASPDLVNPDLTNLVNTISDPSQRYSFVFEGNAQVLDHALVNAPMLARLSRFAYARNNADFPESYLNDFTRTERVSDHDNPIAYFTFPPPAADLSLTKTAAPSVVTAGGEVVYTLTVRNAGPDPALSVIVTDGSSTFTAPSIAVGATATYTLARPVACALVDGAVITNTASVTSSVTDPIAANNTATANVSVSNPAPVVTDLAADRTTLSPPNHKMVDVKLAYGIADNCGDVAIAVTVTSNQPADGTGDGDTEIDWEVISNRLVRLRAERSGDLGDRIYTITVTATDASGATTSQSVTVTVPQNRS